MRSNFLNSFFKLNRLGSCTGRLLILLVLPCVCFTGCGVKTTPVSYTQSKKDSVSIAVKNTSVSFDSIVRNEKNEIKFLPQESTRIAFTRAQWDSLLNAFGQLPKNTPVVYTDPKSRAQLQLMIDSNNKLVAQCNALQYQYAEKHTELLKYAARLESENKSLKQSHTTETKQVVKQKQPWYKTLHEVVWIALILFIAGIVLGIWSKLKKFKFR